MHIELRAYQESRLFGHRQRPDPNSWQAELPLFYLHCSELCQVANAAQSMMSCETALCELRSVAMLPSSDSLNCCKGDSDGAKSSHSSVSMPRSSAVDVDVQLM